jgi:hypothetical protein
MKSAAQVFWPLMIAVLLALFVFQHRDQVSNPLGDHSLETMFSVSRR